MYLAMLSRRQGKNYIGIVMLPKKRYVDRVNINDFSIDPMYLIIPHNIDITPGPSDANAIIAGIQILDDGKDGLKLLWEDAQKYKKQWAAEGIVGLPTES